METPHTPAPVPGPSPVSASSGAAPLRPVRRALTRGNAAFGFMSRSRDREGRAQQRPVWARVGVATVVLGLALWLVGATAAWSFVRFKQGFKDTTVLDFVFIFWRWDDYQRRKGDHYIERAKVALENQQWQDARFLLSVGLSKSPRNLDGRRQLAELLGRFGNAAAGLDVLEAGAAQSSADPAFVRTYLSLLLNAQRDDLVCQLADAALMRPDLPAETTQIYLLAAATACYLRGDYATAETYLTRPNVRPSLDGRLLQARIDWERGQKARTLTQLRALVRDLPKEEQPHALLFEFLRAGANPDEAVEAATLRALAFPRSLDAQLSLLLALRDRADRSRYERELERVLRDLAGQSGLLENLANLAMQTGDVPLAERIGERLRAAGLPPDFAPMMLLQTQLVAREYDAVIAEMQQLNADQPATAPGADAWRAGVLAVAHFGRGENDLGELNLTRLLAENRLRADVLFALGVRLQEVPAPEAARRVFARVVDLDPLQQPSLARLVQLELQTDELADTPRHLEALLKLRKPPPDLLQRALDELGSDHLLFSPNRSTLLHDVRAAITARPTTVAGAKP